ncbi:MAG: hypothetical protein ACTFAK_11020 [Candidatus Electronema sp. VV]
MPGKNLYSDKPGGLLPLFHPAADESDEAAFVAARIQQLLADGCPLLKSPCSSALPVTPTASTLS